MSQTIEVKLILNNISSDKDVENLLNDLNELQKKYSIIDNINVDQSDYTSPDLITDVPPHTKYKSEPMTVFTTNIDHFDDFEPHYVFDIYIANSSEKVCTCTMAQHFEPTESFNYHSFRFNNTELNTHLSFFLGQ